jgi:hypothetical protein
MMCSKPSSLPLFDLINCIHFTSNCSHGSEYDLVARISTWAVYLTISIVPLSHFIFSHHETNTYRLQPASCLYLPSFQRLWSCTVFINNSSLISLRTIARTGSERVLDRSAVTHYSPGGTDWALTRTSIKLQRRNIF